MDIIKNKEFKQSLYFIIGVNIILGIILSIIIIVGINEIKINYFAEKAYSIGYLNNKYPEITEDIVISNFKFTDNEVKEQGLQILKDYGYYSSLDIRFLDNLYEPIKYLVLSVITIFLITLAIQIIHTFIYHKKVYDKINNITVASKEILSQNYDIEIMQYEEGEFSKLAYGFNEMRDVIKSQMDEISKEKDFLVKLTSDISHQLKTPLASTMVFNDILIDETEENDPKLKFLLKSKIQLERMEWLIKSILKLSRIDAKAIKFNSKSNNIFLILKECVNDLEAIASKNNVTVNLTQHQDVMVNCDREWVKEAFINIIKNGIEHSKNSEINICIEDNKLLTKISIEDYGEGIKEEDIPKIFTRFHKSNKTDSVGIGLSLSKSIIEEQNGYIEVKSRYGEGSLFKVIFIK